MSDTKSIAVHCTADSQAFLGRGAVHAVLVNAGGATVARTCLVYDGTGTATTQPILFKYIAGTTDSPGATPEMFTFDAPIKCETGVYVDLAGTGFEVIVYKA